MFSIEHEFDATVITLVDDIATHRGPDVRIALQEDRVTVEQEDEQSGEIVKITLSQAQLSDLLAAADLPEGVYIKVP